MARVGLVSCVSQKESRPAPARDLYASPLFRKAREYVEAHCDAWFVLSARYGLVSPTKIISPYDDTLKSKSKAERTRWAEQVWADLRTHLQPDDQVLLLAGETYRETLLGLIIGHGCAVDVPLVGMGIGRQLQWLSKHLEAAPENRDIDRFYKGLRALGSGLGGKRVMSQCSGRQAWPHSGLYFFFERGETRHNSPEARVVRVGTHGVSSGSKATLWNRLRTHRGTADGLGNHRSSIFRLHVGAAISVVEPRLAVATWGVGQAAESSTRKGENGLERAVSERIGAMEVLWLAIEDQPSSTSDRAYLERNIIGLLSGHTRPHDPPSDTWLGQSSPEPRIRTSGLWNLDFLHYEYCPRALAVFEAYVAITLGLTRAPRSAIAPRDWYAKDRAKTPRNQMSLFEK
jgi:hypothetical protein